MSDNKYYDRQFLAIKNILLGSNIDMNCLDQETAYRLAQHKWKTEKDENVRITAKVNKDRPECYNLIIKRINTSGND